MRPMVFLFCAVLAACGGGDDPRESARHYLEALAGGEPARAFALLAEESRARLAAAEHRWETGADDPLCPRTRCPKPGDSPPGHRLFVALIGYPGLPAIAPLPPDPDRLIGAASIDGDHAWVPVATPLGERELDLVREDAGWRVRLKLP